MQGRVRSVEPTLREVMRLRDTAYRQFEDCRARKLQSGRTDRLSRTPIEELVIPYNEDVVLKLKTAKIEFASQIPRKNTLGHLTNGLKISSAVANGIIRELRQVERGKKGSDLPSPNPKAWKPTIDDGLVRTWYLLRSAKELAGAQELKALDQYCKKVRFILLFRLSFAGWNLFPGGRQKAIDHYAAMVAESGTIDRNLAVVQSSLTEHGQLSTQLESHDQLAQRWQSEPEKVRKRLLSEGKRKA